MKTFLSLLILSTFAGPAQATQMYGGVDISPMIEHFRKQVVTLDRQVVMYNWSPNGGPPPKSDSDSSPFTNALNWLSGNKPVAPKVPSAEEKAAAEQAAAAKTNKDRHDMLTQVRASTASFWRNFGASSGGNMYGYGLYTAVDPVATQSYGYGGSELSWQLLEIALPPGTRLLDLKNEATINVRDTSLTNAAKEIEQKFDCSPSASAEPYFNMGGEKLSPKCAALIYRVFEVALGVDAFAYDYSGTTFADCGQSWTFDRAIVIIRPDIIRSNTVRRFTAQTKTMEAERIRIQTLFSKSVTEGTSYEENFKSLLLNHLNQRPDRDFKGSKTVCEGNTCVISVKFCDVQQNCDFMDLPAMNRPGGPLINAEEFADVTTPYSKLLWPDLVGKPKSTIISTWLKDNKLGCSGTLPYQIK